MARASPPGRDSPAHQIPLFDLQIFCRLQFPTSSHEYCSLTGGTYNTPEYCSLTGGTYITHEYCYLSGGTYNTHEYCYLTGGTYNTTHMNTALWQEEHTTHMIIDYCSLTGGTYNTHEYCYLSGGTYNTCEYCYLSGVLQTRYVEKYSLIVVEKILQLFHAKMRQCIYFSWMYASLLLTPSLISGDFTDFLAKWTPGFQHCTSRGATARRWWLWGTSWSAAVVAAAAVPRSAAVFLPVARWIPVAAAARDPAAAATAPQSEACAIVDAEGQDVVYTGWVDFPYSLHGGQ